MENVLCAGKSFFLVVVCDGIDFFSSFFLSESFISIKLG